MPMNLKQWTRRNISRAAVSPKRSEPPVTIIRPSRGWIPLNLHELWDYREVMYFLAWRDIKVRYKQTVLGAAKLMKTTGKHPAVLRDEVTTPSGTAISAIHELEDHGLRNMLISAVETATKRSKKLSQLIKVD